MWGFPMIIFFGSAKHAERLGEVCRTYCFDCQKNTPWVVGKLTERMSLFDIPMFPFKRDYFIFCDKCGDDFSLSRKDYKQIDFQMKLHGEICFSEIKSQLFGRIKEKTEIQLHRIEANRASEQAMPAIDKSQTQ